MLDPNATFWALPLFADLIGSCGLLAYVGMGPGPEFIPYFMALLGVVGAALLAVVQWPIAAFLGWLRGVRRLGERPGSPDAVESPSADDVPAP